MTGTGAPTLRPLRSGDDAAVARVFAETQLLGRPLPFPLDGAPTFASLAVGWYLEHGRADAVVAVDATGVVIGYGLVCTDPVRHRRWLRRHAVGTTLRLAAMTLAGDIGPRSRAFYRQRARDALHLARHSGATNRLGHAHVNLLPGHRTGRLARAIRDHVDECCRRAGLDGWFGEVNARTGQRRAALRRVAGLLMDSSPNHTLAALIGEPVQRLTVVRLVPPAGPSPAGARRRNSLVGRRNGPYVAARGSPTTSTGRPDRRGAAARRVLGRRLGRALGQHRPGIDRGAAGHGRHGAGAVRS